MFVYLNNLSLNMEKIVIIGAGVAGVNAATKLVDNGYSGELITIIDIDKGIKQRDEVSCEIKYKDGTSKTIKVLCRIDTQNEVEYYKNGGILQYVLRNMLN